MARGWESKSVEAQQADAAETARISRPRLSAEEASMIRERENLRLARLTVVRQIEAATNPRHRELLQSALADLDEKVRHLESQFQNQLGVGRQLP
jgi:hypothetical protein